MAKPIVLIKYNEEIVRGNRDTPTPVEVMEIFQNKFLDYHVLASPVREIDGLFDLEVFYEKDFTEVQYAELKQIIEDSLKQSNQ